MDRRRHMDAIMFHNRLRRTSGFGGVFGVSTINGDAQGGETTITCTNPVSGTSWRIAIDYGKATVDFESGRASTGPRFPGSIPRTAATTRSTANPAISRQVSRRAPAAIFDMVVAGWRSSGEGWSATADTDDPTRQSLRWRRLKPAYGQASDSPRRPGRARQ